MRLTITIDCGNAAFDDAPEAEAIRVIRDAVRLLEHARPIRDPRGWSEPLHDINGNRVGAVEVGPADPVREAAPDLLAALIDAVAMLEVYTDPRGSRVNASTAGQARSTIRDARAAIAKAEGR